MTTLIVGLIIAVLFGAGVGLLVMEHVITQRRRRAFLGQLIGIRTGMYVAKTQVQDQMFANLDEPLTDLLRKNDNGTYSIEDVFAAHNKRWEYAPDPLDPDNYRGEFR